jgi:Pentapeptide repeats (8 copies)
LADQSHLDIIQQGVGVWNSWRERTKRDPDFLDADLTDVDLTDADLSGANLSEANLTQANLQYSILVKTNFTGTTLTGCSIYGISVWGTNLEGAKQLNLNISDVNEPTVIVDNLEVAQFIYLLLNHKKLRNVLNAITERGVLILGRFGGGGLEVLEAIATKLRELKYQPFIFDFDRPADRNYTETVKTLVGLSRFVIVDLSGPSVPQELYATVPHFKIPFVPIIEESRRQYSMFVDILEYPWVLNPPVRFVDVEHLVRAMPKKIIAPAEKWVKDRQDRLADLFDT